MDVSIYSHETKNFRINKANKGLHWLYVQNEYGDDVTFYFTNESQLINFKNCMNWEYDRFQRENRKNR